MWTCTFHFLTYSVGQSHLAAIKAVVLILWISFGWIANTQAGLATWMYVGLAATGLHSPVHQPPGTVTTTNWREVRKADEIIETLPNLEWCHSIPGLVDHQVALCKRNPNVFRQVMTAARVAIHECQTQFRLERWNCPTINDSTVFGKTVIKGNRETAFIAAISSAAVVHAVVQACSSGNLAECGCDMRYAGLQSSTDNYKWAGCSDNLEYGLEFSRLFNDAPEDIKRRDARSIRDVMHLHNKAAGRMTVKRNMRKVCRCHGVSGSCEYKTCWMVMPKFHEIGGRLKKQYQRAVRIAKKSVAQLKRREADTKSGRNSVRRIELVYLEKSPNYCKSNRRKGILGTKGRQCNATGPGSYNCDRLCCKRGYTTKIIKKLDKCRCKFVWCCNVICDTCETTHEVHTCK